MFIVSLANMLGSALNKILPIYIFTPNDGTIGNTAEEIYFALLQARRSKKKLLVLRRFRIFNQVNISNKEIFKLESEQMIKHYWGIPQFAGNLFISLVYDPLPTLLGWFFENTLSTLSFFRNIFRKALGKIHKIPKPKYYPLRNPHFFNFQPEIGRDILFSGVSSRDFDLKTSQQISWQEDFNKKISVRISKKNKALCKKATQQMGIPEGAWHVCFHVREAGYYGDLDAPRNSDINNCIKAMKYITSLGGWVIRMGDASMKQLPQIPQVIDYPFTEFKNPVMDLHLIESCRLYVGSNSGILDVAHLFQKKLVIINSTEWAITFPTRKSNFEIIKHIWSKKLGRFLSISEILDEPFAIQDLSIHGKNYKYYENSENEIYEVVKEGIHSDDETRYTNLQKLFIQQRTKQVSKWLKEPDIWTPASLLTFQRFRIASRMNTSGTLGSQFLEENWNTSSRNKKSSLNNTTELLRIR